MSYLQEIGKNNVLEISSPHGGTVQNAFNHNNQNYWVPNVSVDADGYLETPVELYITFNKFLNMVKFSVSNGVFNSADFKYSLGSPRDFELYTSDTCIKEIPECKDPCTIIDPYDSEKEILIDFSPNWKLALDVQGRGTHSHQQFNSALFSAPFNMSTSLVYGNSMMFDENKSPSYLFDNFELIGGARRINKIKMVITRVNSIENINRIPLKTMYLANLRILGTQ